MQPTMIAKPCGRAPHPPAPARSVSPPVLSSLMLTASYLPTSCGSVATPWQDSSAQTGNGRASPASAGSSAAGKGCSISSTPSGTSFGASSA